MPEMNLADPQLELIDPTPSIHALFIQFDKEFFSTKLASRAVVRWSKRMYSCAGICSYEGKGGLCDIALSEPLLKLRPRKDLVETLLHEMIHAFLFVTNRDQDRNGHGPNFLSHMHRINGIAGLNISVYHDFHDEVRLYQTHWWRCNGPCNNRRPYFGIVRRSNNRAPGPTDFWWKAHKANCGGTFIKIVAPEKNNFSTKTSTKAHGGKNNKSISIKSNGDITKYIKTNNSVPLLNTTSNKLVNNLNSPRSVPVFTGNGYSINNNKPLSDSRNVTEHVRNVWANKQIPTKATITPSTSGSKPNKHKADSKSISVPAAKIMKINDYFKANATLQDLYGQDYKLIKPHSSKKLVAVSDTSEVVIIGCPVCNNKVNQDDINKHLDECLNKDILVKLAPNDENAQMKIPNNNTNNQTKIIEDVALNNNDADFTKSNHIQDNKRNKIYINTMKNLTKQPTQTSFESPNSENQITNTHTSCNNTRKSNSFVTKERGDCITRENASRQIKVEPSTSLSEIPAKIIEVPRTSKSQFHSVQVKTEPGIIKSESEEITEPGTSRNSIESQQKCPCCRKNLNKPVEDHLDECLAFIINDDMLPKKGTSMSSTNNAVIVIDDDEDIFDESLTLNATGTKSPCPCCMKMVEQKAMNQHLDFCLGLWDE